MGVFAKWLTIFILLIAALLLAFGAIKAVFHYDFNTMFMAVVGLSVAARRIASSTNNHIGNWRAGHGAAQGNCASLACD